MEVKIERKFPLGVGVDESWSVLADLRATASCMPGVEITEQVDASRYLGSVRSKVGPAVLVFAGEVELLHQDASRREIRLRGKGADKAGSSASMTLVASIEPGSESAQSFLVGVATVTVNGKLAQFGSRLLLPVMDALLAKFAVNFFLAAAGSRAEMAALPVTSSRASPVRNGSDRELNVVQLIAQMIKTFFSRIRRVRN